MMTMTWINSECIVTVSALGPHFALPVLLLLLLCLPLIVVLRLLHSPMKDP